MNALTLACSAFYLILAFAVRTAVQRRTGWTGCHLHFEMWDAPGWYEGGDPFDPRPAVGGWDRYS